MQSTSESAILQSIEVNSTRQQQAIQQQIKGEKKSPQPLRIKVLRNLTYFFCKSLFLACDKWDCQDAMFK